MRSEVKRVASLSDPYPHAYLLGFVNEFDAMLLPPGEITGITNTAEWLNQ